MGGTCNALPARGSRTTPCLRAENGRRARPTPKPIGFGRSTTPDSLGELGELGDKRALIPLRLRRIMESDREVRQAISWAIELIGYHRYFVVYP